MPPMDIKEWWIAAAAATSLIAPQAQAAARPGEQVGVVTAMRPNIKSSIPERVVYVGGNVAFGERFSTDGTGVMHILFMDQSSITLGPNTEVTIDEFVYNPDKREGNIAVNLLKGALRVVGGFISKNNATRVTTGTATIGIRGGISMVENSGSQTQAVFLFGQQMQVSGADGAGSQTITRPGFGVTVSGGGGGAPVSLSPAFRFSAQDLSRLTQTLGPAAAPTQRGAPAPTQTTTTGGSTGLVSTSDRPSSASGPSGLAPDRTQSSINTVNTSTPSNALRNVLGSSPSSTQS